MKRMLLMVSAAVLFLSTFVIPTAVLADGSGSGGNGCASTTCKP
jgi:hypothetical protein